LNDAARRVKKQSDFRRPFCIVAPMIFSAVCRSFVVTAAVAVAALVAGCATGGSTFHAAHPPPPGFISLFNGQDFSGWAGALDCCRVTNSEMVWQANRGGTIYTQAEFTNFIVRLEFKLPPGGNNGLALRYPGSGDPAYVGLCECQVLAEDYEAVTGNKIDPRQAHGSAYGMVAARRGWQRRVGEWNFQEVTVRGSKMKVVLNGVKILEADLSTVTEFLDGKKHPGTVRASGHFGFAGHNDRVSFRNIFIQPLD
jgi:hypothetical protein